MRSKRIIAEAKNYPWGGKRYIQSLLGRSDSILAELWMGTHERGMSYTSDGVSLKDYLKESSSIETLPFLFKVLSIDKPLSLQCHPDADQAVEGYRAGIFGDKSQKRELLLSLGRVRALIGFTSLDEAKRSLEKRVPLFYWRYLSLSSSIRDLVMRILSLTQEEVMSANREIEEYLSRVGSSDDRDLSLEDVYRNNINDRGVLFSMIMNTVTLSEGECAFIEPRTVHAYLEGNAIELTDPSDNVVRIALTNKEKRKDAFLRIALLEESHPRMAQSLKNGNIYSYSVSVDEFSLLKIESGVCDLSQKRGSVLIVLEGSGTLREEGEDMDIKRGDIVFIPESAGRVGLTLSGIAYMAMAEK